MPYLLSTIYKSENELAKSRRALIEHVFKELCPEQADTVNLFKDGAIKDASCTCPRGQYLCHHVAAVCLFGHHNISVTDVECRWAAKKSKKEEVKTIDEIYMGKVYGTAVGFTWLLGPEPTTVLNLITYVEDFIFSEAYFAAGDKQKCFLEKMKVSPEQIKKICSVTVGQYKNENWLICRKNRLTGSNFGAVLAAISRKKYPPSLYKRLTGFYNLENIKAVQWGNINEGQAIREFTEETKLEVVPTGLWLTDKDWIVNLKLLENFYLQEYLSYIISNAYDV
ncbi:hypothetical protein NQ314_018437 [Rhamnusium bicolor]|uniref:SWIM-type domain-containing protein n=1 Tax=Rhamnusium bicolor TaxID=1586634 RepID=A0AAV8WRE9_9CUCU|nr:hypothetical protein NQ314_018437 [Rhamnusium bicolor]